MFQFSCLLTLSWLICFHFYCSFNCLAYIHQRFIFSYFTWFVFSSKQCPSNFTILESVCTFMFYTLQSYTIQILGSGLVFPLLMWVFLYSLYNKKKNWLVISLEWWAKTLISLFPEGIAQGHANIRFSVPVFFWIDTKTPVLCSSSYKSITSFLVLAAPKAGPETRAQGHIDPLVGVHRTPVRQRQNKWKEGEGNQQNVFLSQLC